MHEPVLIVMAAGMGSRYGGLKQLDPIDSRGHLILDYSLYDAYLAGFRKFIVVIKPEMEALFEERISRRIRAKAEIAYAYQRLEDLPDGFSVPEGRAKPWGTAHAVLSAYHLVDGPFAVVNADDFYGRTAFSAIYDFLSNERDPNRHAMVGYRIENTLTENGYVSRGVCEVDGSGLLRGIVERLRIEKAPGGAVVTEDGKEEFVPDGTIVSMNLWGFQHAALEEIKARFPAFLRDNLPANPLKCEYFLPFIPGKLVEEGAAEVAVLRTDEKWYGVTYHEDRASVFDALEQMARDGLYPAKLWEE